MVRFFSISMGFLVLSLAASAQTPGQYDDIRQALTATVNAVDTLGQDIDQAQNGADVAQAITRFTATMLEVKKTAMELQKKHPELAANGGGPPAELTDSIAELQTSMQKMPSILAKAERYSDDPAVQDALQKMQSGIAGGDQAEAD